MGVPLAQMWTVASYVISQKLRGRRRYPLVLLLEPLFRCNLACAGCGKIQYPAHVLKRHLSVEDCLKAVEECGAPMVSIPGGEPLLHPEIREIVAELVKPDGRCADWPWTVAVRITHTNRAPHRTLQDRAVFNDVLGQLQQYLVELVRTRGSWGPCVRRAVL